MPYAPAIQAMLQQIRSTYIMSASAEDYVNDMLALRDEAQQLAWLRRYEKWRAEGLELARYMLKH